MECLSVLDLFTPEITTVQLGRDTDFLIQFNSDSQAIDSIWVDMFLIHLGIMSIVFQADVNH